MPLPSHAQSTQDGITVTLDAYHDNYWFYERIGSTAEAHGQRQVRKWWCLWLCKRPVSVIAEDVTITNSYYIRAVGGGQVPSGTPVPVEVGQVTQECHRCDSLTNQQSGLGGIIGDTGRPSTISGGLVGLLEGVVAVAAVKVSNRIFEMRAGAGLQP